jgi:hypothetical protein
MPLLISIIVGFAVSIGSYLLIRYVNHVRSIRKEKQFKENYRALLIQETDELMQSIEYLLDESLELAARLGKDEDYIELEGQGDLMRDQMKHAFDEFMTDEDLDSSLGAFTLFRDQLVSMVDKMDHDINNMRENLGEVRIIN